LAVQNTSLAGLDVKQIKKRLFNNTSHASRFMLRLIHTLFVLDALYTL
jgi:hypothetical protein